MDEDTTNTIKIFTALSLAVLVPTGSLLLVCCKDSIYKYWNKLEKLYIRLRRKYHV